jgi:hypothetical protein
MKRRVYLDRVARALVESSNMTLLVVPWPMVTHGRVLGRRLAGCLILYVLKQLQLFSRWECGLISRQ